MEKSLASYGEIQKDILLFYYVQAVEGTYYSDLDYHNTFNKPYWRYLDYPDCLDDDLKFIQRGCLLIIIAKCWGFLSGAGIGIKLEVEECIASLECFSSVDEQTTELSKLASKNCMDTHLC